MTAAQFERQMNQCATLAELMTLFNAHWAELRATFDEQVLLRFKFTNRYAELDV